MPPQAFVCAISQKSPGNLDLCRRHSIWGFTVQAKRWASSVRPHDFLWFYLGRKGIVALAQATSGAEPFPISEPPPWQDGRTYAFRLPLRFRFDFAPPIQTAIQTDHKRYTYDKELGFGNNDIQRGFFKISTAAHKVLVQRAAISLDGVSVDGQQDDIRTYASDAIPKTKSLKDEAPYPRGAVTPPAPVAQEATQAEDPRAATEHTMAQWLLASMAQGLGLSVWIPRADRQKSYKGKTLGEFSVDNLPGLGLPSQVQSVVENIDVLWIDGGMVVCAFEVEHSTAVYSGILRLSDLLAVQPYTPIKLFIVSGSERRQKVRQELIRPTFGQLRRPLVQVCRYLSYDQLQSSLAFTEQYGRFLKLDWVDQLGEAWG